MALSKGHLNADLILAGTDVNVLQPLINAIAPPESQRSTWLLALGSWLLTLGDKLTLIQCLLSKQHNGDHRCMINYTRRGA